MTTILDGIKAALGDAAPADLSARAGKAAAAFDLEDTALIMTHACRSLEDELNQAEETIRGTPHFVKILLQYLTDTGLETHDPLEKVGIAIVQGAFTASMREALVWLLAERVKKDLVA